MFKRLTVWDSKIVRYLSGALTAMTITGCTLLLGLGDKQCSSNAECVDSQLGDVCVDNVCQDSSYGNDAGAGRCSSDRDCNGTNTPRCFKDTCVTSPVYEQWVCPAPAPATTDKVKYSFKVVDFLTREPPANVVVNACRQTDVACSQPVAKFTDTAKTGNAVLMLPSGFMGYFEVLSPEATALLYVTKAVNTDTQNRDVPMLTTDNIKLLAGLAGLPYDPAAGVALLEMIDCKLKPAGGIQFKINRASPDQFYLKDGNPSKDAKLTDFNSETPDGGFLNLTEGFYDFSAYLGENGPMLGSFNAAIRAEAITYIDLSF